MEQPKVGSKSQNEQLIARILSSPSTSNWLRNAMLSALDRDCVDASRDAQLLATVISTRTDELLTHHHHAMTMALRA